MAIKKKNPYRFLMFEDEKEASIILKHAKSVKINAYSIHLNEMTNPKHMEHFRQDQNKLQGIRIDDVESATIIHNLIKSLNMKVRAFGDKENRKEKNKAEKKKDEEGTRATAEKIGKERLPSSHKRTGTYSGAAPPNEKEWEYDYRK